MSEPPRTSAKEEIPAEMATLSDASTPVPALGTGISMHEASAFEVNKPLSARDAGASLAQRATMYQDFSRQFLDRFNATRQIEWIVNGALWAGILVAGTQLAGHVHVEWPAWVSFLAGVGGGVLHFVLWMYPIQSSEDRDSEFARWYRLSAHSAAQGKDPLGSEYWWHDIRQIEEHYPHRRKNEAHYPRRSDSEARHPQGGDIEPPSPSERNSEAHDLPAHDSNVYWLGKLAWPIIESATTALLLWGVLWLLSGTHWQK